MNSNEHIKYDNANTCASCGSIIPEGTQKCFACERRYNAIVKSQRQTLCWSCSRLDCPWMLNLKPVEGWDAEPTIIKNKYGPIWSYFVKSCPLFKQE